MSVRFEVRLTPHGGLDRVDGVGPDGALHVRVSAPPVDGAANESLRRLLARELGLGRGSVRVVAGAAARRKVVEADVDRAAVVAAWPGLAAGGPA